MLTQAPIPGLFAAGYRRCRRGLDLLAGSRLIARMAVALLADVATAADRRGSIAAAPLHRRPPMKGSGRPARCGAASTSFLTLGSPDDRKAFTNAIRAFALARKLGDHLTLIGYGPHRRRLEKWSRALRIERAVTFAHPWDDLPDGAEYDVTIVILRGAGATTMLVGVPTMRSADGRSPDTGATLADEPAADGIRSDDIVALSHAMLGFRRTGGVFLSRPDI